MFNLKQQTKVRSRKGYAAGALIALMMTILIGVAVTISVVDDTTKKATTTYSMANESINLTTTANNQSVLSGFSDGTSFTVLIDTLVIYNSTDCASEIFAYPEAYVLVNNDTANPYLNFTEVGTYVPNTKVCAVYSYRADSYVPSSTARTILSLFTLLVAVVLVTATASAI